MALERLPLRVSSRRVMRALMLIFSSSAYLQNRSQNGFSRDTDVRCPDMLTECLTRSPDISGRSLIYFFLAKKSLPLSSITMKAGKSLISIRQMASIPSSSNSCTSTSFSPNEQVNRPKTVTEPVHHEHEIWCYRTTNFLAHNPRTKVENQVVVEFNFDLFLT